MTDIILGEEQLQALDLMKDFIKNSNVTAFSLIGSAGTGKTTIIKELLKWIKFSGISYILCAPTHKAGLVMRNLTKDQNVTTIHKMLALTPNLEIFDLDFNALEFLIKDYSKLEIPSHGVVICDESSMINDDLFKTLIHQVSMFGSKLVFVGDEAQIQPVNARKTSKVFGLDNSFRLTKIYRQSDKNYLTPILQTLRTKSISRFEEGYSEEGSLYCFTDTKDFIKEAYRVYKEAIASKDILKTKILAYTNKRVKAYNSCMQRLLFNNNDEYHQWEFLTAYENINNIFYNSMDYIVVDTPKEIDINIGGFNYPGFRLMLYDSFYDSTNSVDILSKKLPEEYYLGISNYIEELRVSAIELKRRKQYKKSNLRWVEYFEVIRSFTTPVDLVLGDRLIRGKSFDYGYAISTHKSQGSSIDEVFVDIKNINTCTSPIERRQLQYVALSRTKSNAYILQ